MLSQNFYYFLDLEPLSLFQYTFKIILIMLGSTYSYYKIINSRPQFNKRLCIYLVLMFINIFIAAILKFKTYEFFNILFIIISFTLNLSFYDNKDCFQLFFVVIVSLSINFVLYLFSTILCFFPNLIIKNHSEILNYLNISLIYILILRFFFRIKRFKNGISFFNNTVYQEFINMLILNISSIILFSCSLLSFTNSTIDLLKQFFPILILFTFIMFITIRKSITLYYKHNLLIKELNDLKDELKNKNKEIAELEKENLDFIKSSHSIAHKQKSLEYKLNKLKESYEIANELDITADLAKISNANSNNVINYSLIRTGITEIDDMLEFLQSECTSNKINFDLKLVGNIHHIINNFISVDGLQILLADHIKDAIIAIKHSDNVNRSIFVKLGLIENTHSLHIYDSGIEFEIDTLLKLGTKPITTHERDGGTGLGFMNTFDTLNKTSSSLCINEIGKPCADNFTKEIIIKFDNLHKLEIKSYRANLLKESNIDTEFEISDNII